MIGAGGLLVVSMAISVLFSLMAGHYGGHVGPLQKTAPLLLEAVRTGPLGAILGVCIIIPISEEILFRGLIYGALRKRWRSGVVIVVTALLFALVHMEVLAFVPIFFLGLVLGWARARSNSLGLPILVHSVNNAFAICALLMGAAS